MSKTISKIYSFLLIIFPLVAYFDIFVITPMLFLCILLFILLLLWMMNGNQLIVSFKCIPYLVYVLASISISFIIFGNGSFYTVIIKSVLFLFLFVIFYISYWQVIDFTFAIKLYVAFSLILTVLILSQFVLSRIGHGVSLLPPGIPIVGNEGYTTDLYRMNQISANRYSTIFLEPAHQAEYILPCLVMVLFREARKKEKDYIIAIFLSAGILCTTSSIGILGSFIIWLFYLIYLTISGKIGKSFWLFFFIPILVGIVLYFLQKDDILSNIVERLEILKLNNHSRTEGFRRIKYGWLCIGKLDFVKVLFGIGYQNYGYYLSESGIGQSFIGTSELNLVSYTNGITSMILGLGIIGTLLNLRLFIFDALKSKKCYVYALILVWAIIMFTSSSFDDVTSLLVVVFIMHATYGKEKCITKNKFGIIIGPPSYSSPWV